MNEEEQLMLKVIEHEELKALDAFGKYYKIRTELSSSDPEYNAADNAAYEARATLLFWMREKAKIGQNIL